MSTVQQLLLGEVGEFAGDLGVAGLQGGGAGESTVISGALALVPGWRHEACREIKKNDMTLPN